MNFKPDEIFSLTATIWEAILRIPIEADNSPAIGTRRRSVAACIQITGGGNGAILLDCPDDVARRAASVMFEKDFGSVTVADIQDALAELVNMIGGNFKALLPEVCFLSLPSVVEGGDYSTRVPGSAVFGRVSFLCEGKSVSIVFLEKIKEKAAA